MLIAGASVIVMVFDELTGHVLLGYETVRFTVNVLADV